MHHLFSGLRPTLFATWKRAICVGLSATIAAGNIATAADNVTATNGIALLAGKKGVWLNISEGLLADFATHKVNPIIKFKYDSTNGAGVCGILADRSLPGPLVIIQGQGVWQTELTPPGVFRRMDGGAYDGFYENAGPDIDPAGGGVCLFSIQGATTNSTCAISNNREVCWRALTTDQQAFGYDVGAVDWGETNTLALTILAKKHHNGDLVLSRDGGLTWTLLGKAESRIVLLGVIGKDVLLKGIRGNPETAGLYRSMDAGTNWSRVAECAFSRIGHAVVLHDVAYLTTAKGILTSTDKGEHWALPGEEQEGFLGPVMFGNEEKHMMVYGRRGFFESKDAGKTWSLAVPFGEDPAMRSGRFEYGSWDPKTDCFYLTHIGGQAYVFRR